MTTFSRGRRGFISGISQCRPAKTRGDRARDANALWELCYPCTEDFSLSVRRGAVGSSHWKNPFEWVIRMLTASVNGSRSRPIPGVLGECPFCGSEMIARCGEIKVHHWAHKSKADCDPWWEPETDWHRRWKNEFPIGWQERVFTDRDSGERHIADVQTLAGLTVEFQHSRL